VKLKRYEWIANALLEEIEGGMYRPGERLPGVRRLAEHYQVSVSTVVEALKLVEDQGRVESAERSGHYVTALNDTKRIHEPVDLDRVMLKPSPVTQSEWVMNLVRAALTPEVVQLGAAVPDKSYLAVKGINRALKDVCKGNSEHSDHYDFAPGYKPLRRVIAQRMQDLDCTVRSSGVVITSGCQNALVLALKSVTKPGDIVAIESPTFYGLLHVIESLGLQALEIPTDSKIGISLPALTLAYEQWDVRACVVIPNYGNPLGHCMEDEAKRELVELSKRHSVQLIEDDIYGDLGLSNRRALPLLAFDPSVIYCSSFSKTLSPGLRVGWVVSSEHQERIEYFQYVNSLSAPTLAQRGIYEFLCSHSYDRYLREVRSKYRQQLSKVRALIQASFPSGTRVSSPAGGFVLWVACPKGLDSKGLDSMRLYEAALSQGISIAPGTMFSTTKKYLSCFRINIAQPWDAQFQWAVVTLGGLVAQQLEGK